MKNISSRFHQQKMANIKNLFISFLFCLKFGKFIFHAHLPVALFLILSSRKKEKKNKTPLIF
jgi:hypothetical protein